MGGLYHDSKLWKIVGREQDHSYQALEPTDKSKSCQLLPIV